MQQQVLGAFRHLMRPLVRMLLRNGISWQEFARLCKEVFVDVARSDYGVHGRPTNAARVALITGINRREVAQCKAVLVGEREPPASVPSRLSQVLTAWHTDPQFLGADGTPRVLAADGEGPTVEALLDRYAGDMPHVAVLKQLQQLGLVESVADGFRVRSRDYIRSATDPDLMRQAGVALHDHATTIAHNVDVRRKGAARFERMATNRSLPASQVRAFHEFLEAEGQEFLERVDAWLASHASGKQITTSGRARPARTVRAGVGLYLIHAEEGERT